jgi:hypothetical protein
MYKGGYLVPILMGLMMIVICVIIERFVTIRVAQGKGSVPKFVRSIKSYLDNNDINGAMKACDAQRGSVANVIREGLRKYSEMSSQPGMEKAEKVLAIQKKLKKLLHSNSYAGEKPGDPGYDFIPLQPLWVFWELYSDDPGFLGYRYSRSS